MDRWGNGSTSWWHNTVDGVDKDDGVGMNEYLGTELREETQENSRDCERDRQSLVGTSDNETAPSARDTIILSLRVLDLTFNSSDMGILTSLVLLEPDMRLFKYGHIQIVRNFVPHINLFKCGQIQTARDTELCIRLFKYRHIQLKAILDFTGILTNTDTFTLDVILDLK